MLMSFIKTTLQDSHDELVRTVVEFLERSPTEENTAPATEPVPKTLSQ